MQLKLKQCTIRPWRLDDAESLARHANNRNVWIALRDLFPHPYTIEDGRTFLKSVINSEPVTLFCVEANGAAVGGIGIRIGADVHRQTAELGYWLSQEFWGRGIMTEAVAVFTDFCFENFQLRRVYAEPFANNLASSRVLEKPASLSKDASRTTSSKMGSFWIHFCTPGQSSVRAGDLRVC